MLARRLIVPAQQLAAPFGRAMKLRFERLRLMNSARLIGGKLTACSMLASFNPASLRPAIAPSTCRRGSSPFAVVSNRGVAGSTIPATASPTSSPPAALATSSSNCLRVSHCPLEKLVGPRSVAREQIQRGPRVLRVLRHDGRRRIDCAFIAASAAVACSGVIDHTVSTSVAGAAAGVSAMLLLLWLQRFQFSFRLGHVGYGTLVVGFEAGFATDAFARLLIFWRAAA